MAHLEGPSTLDPLTDAFASGVPRDVATICQVLSHSSLPDYAARKGLRGSSRRS